MAFYITVIIVISDRLKSYIIAYFIISAYGIESFVKALDYKEKSNYN